MGCCSLDAGKVPQRCLQQIANRLFSDVLFQASAATGKRIPLYLGVYEARTPMFLMRHGCRLTHFFGFLHLDRRSDDGSHAHAFPVPMHACVGQAWAANWCVPGPHLLGNAFRLESRHAPHPGDWTVGLCQVGSVSHSARTTSRLSAFSVVTASRSLL